MNIKLCRMASLVAFITLTVASSLSYAVEFEGVYQSKDNVQLNILKTGKNTYSITSDHSKYQEESGHDWEGTGIIHRENYLGVFKYPDNDSKYPGLSGVHEAEFTTNGCIILHGVILQPNLDISRKIGSFDYCKK